MANRQYLHVLVDECGVDVEFFSTKKDFEKYFKWWNSTGTEGSHRLQSYYPTKRGIVALLNSLKQETD